jgi:hypothetical protein
MRNTGSKLKARQVRGLAVVCFLAICCLMIWPIYPLFSKIRPFVFGMPFALFYLVLLLVLTFTILSLLFIWESRHGKVD